MILRTIMENVVVGIPVYTNRIKYFEKIALHQVINILSKYPIVFIAPQSFQLRYGKEYESFLIERFSDDYFKDTYSYSRLLLSREFYKRFIKYQFILIYQLDAFVFADRLQEFCNLNYDYIGGPMGYVATKNGWKTRIGNGGFSLRKVSACIDLLETNQDILLEHEKKWHWNRAEDQFFTFCANHAINGFKAAPVEVGLMFSFSSDARRSYTRNHQKLPFGCHAWYKTDYAFYKPLISSYKYDLPEHVEGGNIDEFERRITFVEYLCNRYIRQKENKNYLQKILKQKFDSNARYIIFGAGKIGRLCLRMMRKDGIEPIGFWDNEEKKEGGDIQSVPVERPKSKKEIDPDVRIIIALRECCTDCLLDDIEEQLIQLGFKRNKSFVRFFNIEKDIACAYFRFKGW